MADRNQDEYNTRVLTVYFTMEDEHEFMISDRIKWLAMRNDTSVSKTMIELIKDGFAFRDQHDIDDGFPGAGAVTQAKIDKLQQEIDRLRGTNNG